MFHKTSLFDEVLTRFSKHFERLYVNGFKTLYLDEEPG